MVNDYDYIVGQNFADLPVDKDRTAYWLVDSWLIAGSACRAVTGECTHGDVHPLV